MKTLKFKTNIKCGGCIATVTPALTALKGVEKWDVDIINPDKVLTLQTNDDLLATQIIATLKQIGYNAQQI